MSLLAVEPPAAADTQAASQATVTTSADNSASTQQTAWTWADESGKFSPDWQSKLGDEFKDNATLKTLPDLKTLAKAYLDTKAMVGKKLAPPSETSTPEEIAKWRELLGVPKSPDEYGSLMPEGFQAELWNGELEKEFAALAHKHNLPPAAVKEIAVLQAKGTVSTYEREVALAKQRLTEGQAELKKAWGDGFERQAAAAKALAAAVGIDETDEIFSTRPDLLQKLAAAAPSLLGQDKIISGERATITGGIEARLAQIRASDDYQGKNGFEKQTAAQKQLHNLMQASTAKAS